MYNHPICLFSLDSFRITNLELRRQLNISSWWHQFRFVFAPSCHLQRSIPSWQQYFGVVRDLLVRWHTNRDQPSPQVSWSRQQVCRRGAMVWHWTRVYIVGHWRQTIGLAKERFPRPTRTVLLWCWCRQSIRTWCRRCPLSRMLVRRCENLRHKRRSNASTMGIPGRSMCWYLSRWRFVDFKILVAQNFRRVWCKCQIYTRECNANFWINHLLGSILIDCRYFGPKTNARRLEWCWRTHKCVNKIDARKEWYHSNQRSRWKIVKMPSETHCRLRSKWRQGQRTSFDWQTRNKLHSRFQRWCCTSWRFHSHSSWRCRRRLRLLRRSQTKLQLWPIFRCWENSRNHLPESTINDICA